MAQSVKFVQKYTLIIAHFHEIVLTLQKIWQ